MSRRAPQGGEIDVAAALRAGEDREASRRRRAVLAGLAALALTGGLGLVGRELMKPSLADLAGEERAAWKNAETIAPMAEPGAAAGEQVLPFDTFGIAADSEPPGAEVRVGARLLGRTPLAVSVECVPGERVTVRYQLRGRPVRELATTCRASGLVKQRARL